MQQDLNELEAAVLALPPEQRSHLAERLLESLEDETGFRDPEEVERAWMEEVKRRQQRLRAGEAVEIPAAEAFARARAGLRLPDNSGRDCDSDDPAEVQRAWIEEAERRYQEYLAGGVEVIPASEALAQVRAELSRS